MTAPMLPRNKVGALATAPPASRPGRFWSRKRVAFAIVLALAVASGATGVYVAAHPSRMREASVWVPSAEVVNGAAKVFHPLTAGTFNCGDEFTGPSVAAGGALYVTEDTCVPTAGGTEPGRYHPNKHRPRIVLNALLPNGTVRQLPAPGGRSFGLVGVTASGDVIANGKGQMLRLDGTRWRPFSRAQDPRQPGEHTGDGGNVMNAKVLGPVGLANGSNGDLLIAEPYSIRRIDPAGTITTIAGTNAFDPPSDVPGSITWGSEGYTDRPLNAIGAQPVAATSVPLPQLNSITTSLDGTIWAMSHRSLYRLTDGMISLYATFAAPRGTSGDLVLLATGQASGTLDAVDSASGQLSRIDLARRSLRPLRELPDGTQATVAADPAGRTYVTAPDAVYRLYGAPGSR